MVVEVEKSGREDLSEKLEQKVKALRHLKSSRNAANWKHHWQEFCLLMNANRASGKEDMRKVAIFILILMGWTH